jgi:hypothetical protein
MSRGVRYRARICSQIVPAISNPKLANMNQYIKPPNIGVRFEFRARWIQIHTATHLHVAYRAPFKFCNSGYESFDLTIEFNGDTP